MNVLDIVTSQPYVFNVDKLKRVFAAYKNVLIMFDWSYRDNHTGVIDRFKTAYALDFRPTLCTRFRNDDSDKLKLITVIYNLPQQPPDTNEVLSDVCMVLNHIFDKTITRSMIDTEYLMAQLKRYYDKV